MTRTHGPEKETFRALVNIKSIVTLLIVEPKGLLEFLQHCLLVLVLKEVSHDPHERVKPHHSRSCVHKYLSILPYLPLSLLTCAANLARTR